MIQPAAREPQARANIFEFEIRHLLNDLFGRKPICQEIQNVAHPNSHTTNAGTPTALLGVYGYAIHQFGHSLSSLA